MHFTLDRAALLKPLAHVQSVVERRTTIPILSNVMIQADSGKVSISATDMDIDIVESVPAEVKKKGSITCPAHTLHDIVRKLPDGSQVELAASDSGRVTLRAGRSTFTLQTLPTEEFPALSGDTLPHRFELPAGDLRTLIDRTRFAISTEETRYYLNGIYLHAAKQDGVDVLRAVATDGHRQIGRAHV